MSKSANLGESIQQAPRAFDVGAAAQLREAWGAEWSVLTADEASLIEGAAGCSPYLRRLMQRAPARVLDILRAPPGQGIEGACAVARDISAGKISNNIMGELRAAKESAALAAALADIAGAADAMLAAQWVSDFADAASDAAIAAAAAKNSLPDGAAGIASIAMGKLGAHELNYSSDIDLIIIYDEAAMRCDPGEARQRAVRVAKDVVAILQDQTADGYVFRTDLRLRPDPGVTALAISATAAESYYESFGQNWERMAYIKARAHAGDIALGEGFLANLRPFVWRKFLDFAAIEDIKAVKRQLHSAKGGGEIEFAGHDVKTGRGGIREIEFFAQTQQLILGGKDETLRRRKTLEALCALTDAAHVTAEECAELSAAYRYLRHVEHRLQMINDQQTHKSPKTDADIARDAMFTGEKDVEAFKEKLLSTLETVKTNFDRLFHEDALEVAQPGPLVFTGVESDAATLQTLEGLGFQRAAEISRAIRRWHAGGVRATRTERARNILTKLMAPLLVALSKSSDPDAAFFAFDSFLSRLPAGVQIFSLLANNVALFDTLIEIITISPFLGAQMSKHGNFVEALLEQGFHSPLPDEDSYGASLDSALATTGQDYESALNAVRRWAGEAKFFVAAKLAAGAIGADIAGAHFSAIADACIRALVPVVEQEMRRAHGEINGVLSVVAMGRLGSRELTAASDIDLIFVYDAPDDALSTPGEGGGRALGGVEYYTRMVRRLVTALSAATQEGSLYEVDMALRPSGGAGPAAVSLSAFRRYYKEDAWTWEVMALTKARVVAGDTKLAAVIEREIETIVSRPREAQLVARDVDDMRRRLAAAKPGAGPWDVKHIRGGLTDIEFVFQYLALISAASAGRPPASASEAIAGFCDRGLIDRTVADTLISAHRKFTEILHAARAASGGTFTAQSAGEALSARIAEICGVSSLAEAETALLSLQERVAQYYRQVLGLSPDDTG